MKKLLLEIFSSLVHCASNSGSCSFFNGAEVAERDVMGCAFLCMNYFPWKHRIDGFIAIGNGGSRIAIGLK